VNYHFEYSGEFLIKEGLGMMENYAFVVVVVVVVEAMERKRAGLAFVYCIFLLICASAWVRCICCVALVL
jgi:hypothetical protein